MKLIRCTHKRPDWFQLPVDLIGDIAKRISHIEDFVSFGSVCKSWHSVTLDKNCRSGIRDLPWVMFPEEAMFAEEVLTDRNTFYSLSTKKTYYSHLPKILHELHSCLRISRFGWLMVREYMKTNPLNPLSRVRIQLPSLELEERFFNAVLSASPLSSTSHDNCIVMIINKYQDGLLFCRPGDNSWTTLEQDSMPRHSYGYGFCSIVYFKCQFYALTYDSELWICDVSIPRPKASKLMPDNVASPIEIHSMWLNGFFLVEVGDELLLVYQKMDRKFEVYRFDFSAREWKKLNSLGDYAVFVGNKSSFALSALEYPGLKGGCIYFFDRTKYFDGKTGIYNFNEEKMIKSSLPRRKHYNDHDLGVWIKPSLI